MLPFGCLLGTCRRHADIHYYRETSHKEEDYIYRPGEEHHLK